MIKLINNISNSIVLSLCIVLLLGGAISDVNASPLTQVTSDKISLCSKDLSECIELTYEDRKLTVKNANGGDATINIANANLKTATISSTFVAKITALNNSDGISIESDANFQKKTSVKDGAGFVCKYGNYDSCESQINSSGGAFGSIKVDRIMEKTQNNKIMFDSNAYFYRQVNFGYSNGKFYFDGAGDLNITTKKGTYKLYVNKVNEPSSYSSDHYAIWEIPK